ncbi:MAG: formylglycine-generating enzyme family protein [Acidobacteria bacterium]|nr:formylglycine-generating enzyme family protein [Acidobacteriota bacterium]
MKRAVGVAENLLLILLGFSCNSTAFGAQEPSAPAEEKRDAFARSVGMKFVRIPPGSFTMGSPDGEPGRFIDETQHRVTLSRPFELQTTEVTQGQWEAVMGNNPSYFRNAGKDAPVESVSWEDCQEFIRKLNEKDPGKGYRLPA